tara:strand:- start:22213 stop:23682 length:1470 start_codon:yes stop_codon:yes gene_type:complete
VLTVTLSLSLNLTRLSHPPQAHDTPGEKSTDASDGYEEDFSSDLEDDSFGTLSDDNENVDGQSRWRRRAPQLSQLFRRPRGAIRSAIRAKRKAIGQKGKKAIRATITGDKSGSTRVRDFVKLPRAVQTIDKVSFTLGVVGLLVTQFVCTEYPEYFHAYYLATAPAIFAYRAYQYYSIKYHYFLIDFCYYANGFHFLQILLGCGFFGFSTSNNLDSYANVSIFKTTFAYANGPILWAIPLWRNSLVFHSHDKVQSVYIHCVPALLTWCARWYGQSGLWALISGTLAGDDLGSVLSSSTSTAEASFIAFNEPVSVTTGILQFYVYPTLGYLAWQTSYLIKTELWDVKRLDEDPELVTSLRWLANDYKAGVTKFALKMSRKIGLFKKDELFDAGSLKTKFVFVSLQLVYTVVTFLPIPLCYQSKTVHTVLMLLTFLSCIWNGAEYYIDIFSRRYAKKFEDNSYRGSVRDEDNADAALGRVGDEGNEAEKKKR